MDTGKIIGIFGNNLKQVVCGSGHQMALQHIRNTRHRPFKCIQQLIRLAL